MEMTIRETVIDDGCDTVFTATHPDLLQAAEQGRVHGLSIEPGVHWRIEIDDGVDSEEFHIAPGEIPTLISLLEEIADA